ncbi:hypothetical protein DFJ73DRAFT_625271 [Zopfochytrium polystomum]|nr:hypothetical protein DFJ73DRAFT_625271 [Zopfochytrium polystomum]
MSGTPAPSRAAESFSPSPSWKLRSFLLALFLLLTARSTVADEHNHSYKDGEQVVVWANGIGPYHNRQETYDYFQLPFCQGDEKVDHRHESLGEALLGVNLVNTGMAIAFKKSVKNAKMCDVVLDTFQIEAFRRAVELDYWYQFYIDDLPVYGFVGDKKDNDLQLFTHKDIVVKFNNDQIIEVTIENRNATALNASNAKSKISFTYSVEWKKSDGSFKSRHKNYITFFEHKIHWFSIFNSFMMVLFLIGLVIVILLRTLKRDLARYDREEALLDLDKELGEEYGWKQVHGDVFRAPMHLTFLSATLGTGLQLSILTFFVILYSISADIEVENSQTLSASLFLYAVTSIIAGYYSGSFYTKYGGKSWVRLIFVTAGLFPTVLFGIVIGVNFIAIAKNSTRAIPFTSMLAVLAIWTFCVFPLSLVGVILGRNWAGTPGFPCRINPIPRPIPHLQWYAQPKVIVLLGGLLPFASIFIEMYYIFMSFWEFKSYYVYGFLMLVFLILVVVTACVSVVSTYFLLNSENHRWNWTAFLASGSTAGYVFLYAVYYFFSRSKMYGVFQTIWYFGYTSLGCLALFSMLGFVGHYAAEKFIRTIYRNLKID